MVASEAKIFSLNVRPLISADISFNMPGIIYRRNIDLARIGTRLTAIDLQNLYEVLGEIMPAGKQKYNSAEITKHLKDIAIFSIRNEPLAAKVDQAIVKRHSAYLRKYKHISDIVVLWKKLYPERVTRISRLIAFYDEKFEALKNAYSSQNNEAVTFPVSLSQHTGKITSNTNIRPLGVAQDAQIVTVKDENGTKKQTHETTETRTTPIGFDGTNWIQLKNSNNTVNSHTVTTDYETKPNSLDFKTHQTLNQTYTQISTNTNDDFRFPSKDNEISNERTMATLQEELFIQEIANLQTSELKEILESELQQMDLEVRGLQLNFLHTFLLSPISGLVTSVYKDAGESVEAGEPVLRIEDDSTILLCGNIQHRAALKIGQTARIEAQSVFESSKTITLNGKIVALRGHDADDDIWEIIIECPNSKPDSLPINYQFERYRTSLFFG